MEAERGTWGIRPRADQEDNEHGRLAEHFRLWPKGFPIQGHPPLVSLKASADS